MKNAPLMILEEDSLLQFNYDPVTDILSINLPDMIGTPLPEIEKSVKKLAHNISYFDVKKILIDVHTGVIGVDDTHYKEFVKMFVRIIRHSRLEKNCPDKLRTSRPGLPDRKLCPGNAE